MSAADLTPELAASNAVIAIGNGSGATLTVAQVDQLRAYVRLQYPDNRPYMLVRIIDSLATSHETLRQQRDTLMRWNQCDAEMAR